MKKVSKNCYNVSVTVTETIFEIIKRKNLSPTDIFRRGFGVYMNEYREDGYESMLFLEDKMKNLVELAKNMEEQLKKIRKNRL